jgi:ornithine decarboxylase
MLKIQKQNFYYPSNEIETPFLVIDKSLITKKYLEFKQVSENLNIFYALKANPDPEIIKHLQSLGSGFEIASISELNSVINAGVGSDHIITSNPNKTVDFIKAAYQAGVKYYVFDSIMEIEKLSSFAPGSLGYLRVVVDNSKSEWPLSKKFGVKPKEALRLLEYAKKTNIKPYGLTFHVGSQCMDAKSYVEALTEIADIYYQAKQRKIDIKMINIGGGMPILYKKNIPQIGEIKNEINQAMKKLFGNEEIALFTEPGRSLVGDSGNITTKIILRAERGNENWLYLDIGVFNGLMETLEGIKYKILSERHILGNIKKVKQIPYTIAGPSCDSVDTIFENYLLPEDLKLGDVLYLVNTAAYTTAYASNFNGLPIPKIYFIEK